MKPNILVCVKQVPDPKHFHRLKLDEITGALDRSGVPLVTNPRDKNALAAALTVKEAYGGTITALTMGPPSAREVLEDALALGADAGVLLSDPAFAGADTLATTKIIAAAIPHLGSFDLLLCGDETADGATRQVPVQLAAFLGIPYVTSVKHFSFTAIGVLTVEKRLATETMIIEVKMPVLLALAAGINTPRLPTVAGIIAAAGKPIRELTAADCYGEGGALGVEAYEEGESGIPEARGSAKDVKSPDEQETRPPLSPTQVFAVEEVPPTRGARMLTGDAATVAAELARIIRAGT